MARWLYTLFYYLALPLIVLRLFYRGIKAPQYRRRIAERFGIFTAPANQPSIWVHSVSVGETIAAIPIIEHLLKSYPDHRIVVTTMTPTGSERVISTFADRVFHVYAPYDTPGAVKRFLKRSQPALLVVMETELWPNIIHYSARQNIPVLLANARLSERSAKGYQRVAGLTRSMLGNISLIAAQHQADGDRFTSLGLKDQQLAVTGSIKLDVSIEPQTRQAAQALRAELEKDRPGFIWIAASTHEGEDEQLLSVHRQLLVQDPSALLILVPRHPERFDKVAELASQQLATLRRSGFADGVRPVGSDPVQVLVGDSMGELLMLYGCADVAFVGGSLVERGGHNMLEPAAWGLPILTGPHNFNFEKIAAELARQGGLQVCQDQQELAQKLIALAQLPADRQAMGEKAEAFVRNNRGALQRLLRCIDELLCQKSG
jgi:3-deoxy-D-manno-octulosonic-acid transferase